MPVTVTISTTPVRGHAGFKGIRQATAAWMALRRSRIALLRLGDAHLADVGLTRTQAEDEARRSLLVGD